MAKYQATSHHAQARNAGAISVLLGIVMPHRAKRVFAPAASVGAFTCGRRSPYAHEQNTNEGRSV